MKPSRIYWCALLSVTMLLTTTAVQADVRLPKVIGDSMVIQQQQTTAVWGWADAGEKVTVDFGKSQATATANKDGRWMVKLDPPKAGGPYTMTVSGKNKITLKDILVGEVWVCSGQSNMQWSVRQALNPNEEIAAAKYPSIRLFTVARNPSATPQDDCAGKGQQGWKACSPQTVAGFSAVAYFHGRELRKKLKVPVGLINTSWGGTIADAWTSRATLESDKDFKPILDRAKVFKPGNPNQASALYNGMINPIVPFSFRGAIWYQGESNVGRADQYRKLFPAMITDWRTNWKQGDFPFIFVGLAPFRYGRHDPELMAELWDAQFKTLSLVNTGMAVTTDIGNIKNIHPKNKQEVGRRLALWALGTTYGNDKLVYSGPLYDSLKAEAGKIRLSFKHVGGGLVAEGGPLSHFTIAGEDGKFVVATAVIDGDSIVVSSKDVPKPTAVRFGWTDTAEPNLFNKEGLPAAPFRTDNFKLKTAGKL